jgi:hypothetical protein
MNKMKVGRVTVLLALATLFLGMTVMTAKAYIEPDDWSNPAIYVQDTNNTPGQGSRYLWYEDSKGFEGAAENELLYVYVDWDNDYIYARWDTAVTAAEYGLLSGSRVANIYYLVSLDTLMRDPPVATRLLQFEVNSGGYIQVTVRDAGSPTVALWTGTGADYRITSIVPPKAPVAYQTAVEGRFPWSAITGSGPADILLIKAESRSGPAVQGLSSEVMDYIGVGENPVPWFSSLMITMLVAVVAVAFLVKKKDALSIGKASRT